MRLRDNQKGMSLVEIIIVIAVIGILAGTSISMLSYIMLGNTQKAAKTISTAIEKQQANTMSKAGVPYLYIYKLSDGYYMKTIMDVEIADSSDTNFSMLDDSGTKIAGTNVTISKVDPTDATGIAKPVTETEKNFIRVVYKKSGVFDFDDSKKTNVNQIIIDGTGSYTITLIKATGKHILE